MTRRMYRQLVEYQRSEIIRIACAINYCNRKGIDVPPGHAHLLAYRIRSLDLVKRRWWLQIGWLTRTDTP